MTALAAVADRGHPRPTRRQIADYSLVGVLLLAFGNAFVMWAEKRIPSGIAALVVATVPLWLILLDGLRAGGERWTVRGWAGTAIGLLGVALVARPEGGVSAGHWWAIGALQVATLAWTIGSLYAQSLPKRLPLFTRRRGRDARGRAGAARAVLRLPRGLVGVRGRLGAVVVRPSRTWSSSAR